MHARAHSPERPCTPPPRPIVCGWVYARSGRKHMQTTKNLLDASVLQETIYELIGGDVTFLEAFDRTGRVLNITVTRSDGKAPVMRTKFGRRDRRGSSV